MASYPTSIQYVVPQNDVGAAIDTDDSTVSIAAGQNFELNLIILDQEGRVYSDENRALAKIVFESGQDLGSQALLLGSDAVAKNGIFQF